MIQTPIKPPQEAVATQSTDNTFRFIVGWLLLITILTFVNKSRAGHVMIYYSLLLIILLIIVAEYQQLAPLVSDIPTITQFNTGG